MTPLKHTLLVLTAMFFFNPHCVAANSADSNSCLVYFGTSTGKKSQGIYVARFDTLTGKMTAPQLAAATPNPMFLALSPKSSTTRPFLYAANEVKNGAVTAFSINAETGTLTPLNQQSSQGDGPCHLSVDATGKCLLVANYGSGSIAAMPINNDGSLAPPASFIQHSGSSADASRQKGPHAHWIGADPQNRFALSCDLGLDKVLVYRLDAAKGTLSSNEPAFARLKPGSGPRHLVFHPKGQFAYVINEMADTLTVFLYEAQRGTLKEIQTIPTLPEDFAGQNSTAELETDPSGRFLYASNRGHDSLAVFAIDPQSGKLSLVEHKKTQGKTPRSFGIDPTGRWLIAANQGSDNLVLFRIDPASGKLNYAGQTIDMGAPVCVKFLPLK